MLNRIMDSADTLTPGEQPETPFHHLDHYLAIPRVSGLTLSPDGKRLVTTVSTLNGKGTEFASALWEIDPTGRKHARRITRSSKGEAGAVFAANGDLYFTSARPDPDSPDADPVNALWLLPADGGEARVVHSRAGGISSVMAAKDADATFVSAEVLAGSADEDNDDERRKARKDNKVSAILHSGYPVRYWDADLGPAEPRIFAVEQGDEQEPGKPSTVDAAAPLKLRNLTPGVGGSLRESKTVVSPDGKTIYTSMTKALAKADSREVLAAIDVATGNVKVLLDHEGMSYFPGPVSPDNGTLVVESESDTTPTQAPQVKLHLLNVADGETTDLEPLAHHWDRWATVLAWLPDGSAVLAKADDDGASPVFLINVADGGGHPGDAGRFRLFRRRGFSRRDCGVCPAELVRIPRRSGPDRPRHRRSDQAAGTRRAARLQGTSGARGNDGGRRRTSARLPCAPRRGVGRKACAAPAVDPRRPAGFVERLDVALESLAARRQGLRRAAARSRAFHRLRPGIHPARLGRVGQEALH